MKPKKPLPGAQTKKPTLPWWYFGLLVCVLGIAVFLRLWYLDRVPTGLVSDELDYVLNAKAIYHTGSSITSKDWSPLSLTTVPDEIPKAEFPYIISLPFVGPLGMSIFTARIGYALMSVVYVLLVAATATAFFTPWVGLVAGFVAAINPWSIYYGRTAYDVPIAITGYLAALWILAKYKGPKLLFAIIPLFIGFYSYIGTKVLFIPYVGASLIGVWLLVHKKRETLWLVLIGIISVLIFGHFLINLKSLDANERVNQLFTPFAQSIVSAVDGQRRLTLESPLTMIFANKPVVYLKATMVKFFGAFSPSILFTNGEGIATFSLWEHGLFYPIDALFLLIGIGLLFHASPWILTLFLILMAVSTLPSVLSTAGTTYVHRSSLMYPLITILIAYGMESSVRLLKKHWRAIMLAAIALAYLFSVINFAYLYYFRFPYYNSESFGLSQRIYSRYMTLANTKGVPVVNISASSSVGYFRNYLFYTDAISKESVPAIRNAFATKNFTWGASSFVDTCPTADEVREGKSSYILSDTSPCKELFIKQPMIAIPTLSDGGTLYMIFNDKVCGQYALSSYPSGFTIDDFDIENIPEKLFCERFLIRYSQSLYLPQDKNGRWLKPGE